MGREIVYCWKCATRLQSDDFENKRAFRAGDKVSCSECVFDLVAELPAEEQEAILNPQKTKKPSSTKIKTTAAGTGGATTQVRRAAAGQTRSGQTSRVQTTKSSGTGVRPNPNTGTRSIPKKGMTRPIPKVAPPSADEGDDGEEGELDEAAAKKKKLLLIGGISGGAVIVILLVCVALFSGSDGKKRETPVAEEKAGPATKKPATAKVESPKEQSAKTAFLAAQNHKSQNADLAVQWKAWKDLDEAAKGTSYEGKSEPELALIKERIDKEISDLDKESKPLKEQEQYKKLLDLWESNQARHDLAEWKDAAALRLKQYTGIMEEEWLKVKREVRKAVSESDDAKRQECVQRVSTWGFPEKTAQISQLKAEEENPDAAAPGAPDSKMPGRAMSAEMKAFYPIWSQAVLPAFARDYSAAADAILKAGRDQGGDEVKKAAEADSADLRALQGLADEGRKGAAAGLKVGQSVTLFYQSTPSEWKKVVGKVVKVDPQRIELSSDQKDKPKMFVEVGDLAAVTLAEFYLATKRTPDDEKLGAILCLLEGDVDGAKKTAGRSTGRVADRFWQIGAEIREKAPKASPREFEARNLFHQAEFEFRELRTRGLALDKYRMLLADYGGTEYVRRNQVSIGSHGNEGKEYVFYPKDLKTPGAMNTFKITKKYSPKAEEAIVTTKEIDFQACAENYIQVEFYALPNTSYRCFMYIGGCCLENMSFYYQMSEGKVNDKGKEKSIEPGGRAIDTYLPNLSGLPKEHAKHKPKDPKAPHPKDATRWDWVELKLPKTYAAPGAKEIRILTEQPGFGIGYVLITSKTTPFDPKIKADLDKEILTPGTPKENQLHGMPKPKDWMMIGPRHEPFLAEFGPEKEIDGDTDVSEKTGFDLPMRIIDPAGKPLKRLEVRSQRDAVAGE